jgi:hypothetical protein
MLLPSPTLARKDFGSKDGPGSIVTARPAQSSAGPGVTEWVWEMTDLVEMLEAFEAREKAAQNIQEHPEK